MKDNQTMWCSASLRAPQFWSVLCGMIVAGAGCGGSTANVELDAARTAIAQARAERASDCAPGLVQAAEQALAEAAKLNDSGDADAAKRKASDAATLAAQAQAASPPGCDEAQAEPAPPPPPTTQEASRNMEIGQVVEPIYFDYNDATIRDQSKEVLSRIAEVLLNAPGQRLEIEGHCDVRGSTEYNLHLGERRAHAVLRYLVKQGVGADQVTIISYGEERPVDLGISESAHQRNRRAELRPL